MASMGGPVSGSASEEPDETPRPLVERLGLGAVAVLQKRRPPCAGVVAMPRVLDLDDVRAHVGEQHRAQRAREDSREVNDGEALKRQPGA